MPRRGENIYKRKDGRWEGRYIKEKTNAGKSKYGYVYGKTYREVKQKLHSKLILKHSGDDNRSEIITFNTIAIEWLDEIKPTVKVSTWNKYYNLLHLYVLPELGEFAICDITPNVIQISTKQLLITGGSKNSGLSAKTVSDIVSVIRSVLRHASTKGIALNNDIQSIKIRQSPKDLRVLSLAEQETLVHHLLNNSNDYNAGILVCLFTGLRIGEICALRWDDISLDEHTIHVHQTMQRVQNTQSESKKTQIIFTEPKSRCSIRTIPIPDILYDVILQKSKSKGYFLTNSEKRYIEPRTMQNHFKTALKDCNLPIVNFHVLRHTFATRCIEIGFDVKSLSEILGHASVNITMSRYVHPSMKHKQQNMQLLSNLFAVK